MYNFKCFFKKENIIETFEFLKLKSISKNFKHNNSNSQTIYSVRQVVYV